MHRLDEKGSILVFLTLGIALLGALLSLAAAGQASVNADKRAETARAVLMVPSLGKATVRRLRRGRELWPDSGAGASRPVT